MGLDMYLEADLFVGGQYEHRKVKGVAEFTIGDNEKEYRLDASNIQSITRSVGYWRKANAIHDWFVQHVQEGKDECQRSWVSRKQLIELKAQAQEVLDARTAGGDAEQVAQEILPPKAGFFFGSYEIDEWYYQDMEETISIIDSALAMPDDYEFYYQASW